MELQMPKKKEKREMEKRKLRKKELQIKKIGRAGKEKWGIGEVFWGE